MKGQRYIILVLACALFITMVLWNNGRKETNGYQCFVETSYQKSLIDLTSVYSELLNLTEEIKKYNYRDGLMNVAIDNQLASLGRISADLSTITAVLKTETPLSKTLRMHSLHPIEKGLKNGLVKKEGIDKINQLLTAHLEELKQIVFLDSDIFLRDENQLRVKEILEEIEAEISLASGASLTTAMCKIIVGADPLGGGRVTGSGTYMEGQKVTVEAEPGEGFVFAGWQDDREIIRSFSRKFEFEADAGMTLSAVFDDSKNAVFDSILPDSWKSEGAVPQLSPGYMHLLGLQNGVLTLNGFPGNNLISAFPAEENQLIRGFKWATPGDAFAYHTEHKKPGECGGVYIADLDGTTEKIVSLGWPELSTRQILWSPCGRYLFWTKPFSIYNRETGKLLARKDLDDQYSFVHSPLFSDDGSKLAFTLFREDDGSENLWVMELCSGTVRQVTDKGEGDYPFCWIDNTTLLVRVGAIGTGGGAIYDLVAVDLKTGSRKPVSCPTDSGEPTSYPPRRLYIAKEVSPMKDFLLGESRDTAGAGGKIFRQDLKSGKRETILEKETPLEGYSLAQVLWINEAQMLLNIKRESYNGEEPTKRYLILKYSKGNECTPLLESKGTVHLLGVKDSRLYYLESNKTGSHWSWRIQMLPDEWAG